jgi:predicted permease
VRSTPPAPPWLATFLLRLWRLGDRRAEIEADLAELFHQRAAEKGLRHARRRYVVDALSLWRHCILDTEPVHRRPQPLMSGVLRDVVFATRLFRRQPGIVGMTIAGMAVAIGVSTAVLTLVNAVAFRDMGIRQPHEVYRLKPGDGGEAPWSYGDFVTLQKGMASADVTASFWGAVSGEFRRHHDVDRANLPSASVTPVSGNFFPVLGARAKEGRLLGEADDTPGTERPLVLSNAFWQSQFRADAAAVGQTVWISDQAFRVIGVTEAAFDPPSGGGTRPSGWTTLSSHFETIRAGQLPRVTPGGASTRPIAPPPPIYDYVRVFVRTKPGIDVARAETELTAFAGSSAVKGGSGSPTGRPIHLDSLDSLSPSDARLMAMVMTPAALLVLVACANVTNLLLASAAGRAREIGTRRALGASRGRITRQLLTEGMLVGGLGGAAGLIVAMWTAPVLGVFVQVPPTIDTSPNLGVYLAATTLTIAMAVVSGLAPARQSQRRDLPTALRFDRVGAPRGVTASRLRSLLIAVQAAASILLLVLASLLTRSVLFAAGYDHGADLERLVNVSVHFNRDTSEAAHQEYLDAAVDRLQRTRGVASVARAEFPPFFRGGAVDGVGKSTPNHQQVGRNFTSATYFETIGAKLLLGRTYSDDEVQAGAPVAVITERLARDFWGAEDPIGSSLERLWGPDDPADKPPSSWARKPAGTRVIGVVQETTPDLQSVGRSTIYLPDDAADRLVVRSDVGQDPEALIPALHGALSALDPKISRTIEAASSLFQHDLKPRKIYAALGVILGFSSLTLAVVGIFGITAFVVSQRRYEISVRLALGATKQRVIRLLVLESLKPVLIGLACGLTGSFFLDRFLRAMLIGIGPHDAVATGSAIAVLVLAAAAAAFVPAQKAGRVDPAAMLKEA